MANSHVSLTNGACLRLIEQDADLEGFQPVLQCLSLKKLGAASTASGMPDRYRMIISDGDHFIQSMLNTKLNGLVESNALTKNSIFTLKSIANNIVQNKRLLIVLQIGEDDIIPYEERIGAPVSLEAKADPTLVATASTAQASVPEPSSVTMPKSVIAPKPPFTAPSIGGPQRSAGGEKPPPIYPIEGLSPYQNKWSIKARVTQKSEIKEWANTRGRGKLFNMTLMDETGEIRATGFNKAVDELFDRIEEGKVYYLSRARVNVAKKKFGNLTNEYEIMLDERSEIHECPDAKDVPDVKFNFVELSQMEALQKDHICDVVAVVHELGHMATIVSKTTNKDIPKRELVLVDETGYSIRITLWGKQAESFEYTNNPVVAFKGVKVGDYGGRTLSTYSGSTFTIDPDIPQAHALRGWYDNQGASTVFRAQSAGGAAAGGGGSGTFNRSELKTLGVVQDTLHGLGDKPDYFSARATVIHVKPDNLSYTSCPGPNCQKKVIEQEDGSWRCEKCAKSYDHCEYRYLLSMSVADYTGQIWLQGFNDVAELILGISAKALKELTDEDPDAATAKIDGIIGKPFNLSCRVKQETYNDQSRPRYGINRAFVPDFNQDGLALLEQLRKYPPSV